MSGDCKKKKKFYRQSLCFSVCYYAENEDEGDTVQVVPDIGPTVKSTALSQMEAAIVALSRELSKLRTGRASAGILSWPLFLYIIYIFCAHDPKYQQNIGNLFCRYA